MGLRKDLNGYFTIKALFLELTSIAVLSNAQALGSERSFRIQATRNVQATDCKS
jgi:hypothetical protein